MTIESHTNAPTHVGPENFHSEAVSADYSNSSFSSDEEIGPTAETTESPQQGNTSPSSCRDFGRRHWKVLMILVWIISFVVVFLAVSLLASKVDLLPEENSGGGGNGGSRDGHDDSGSGQGTRRSVHTDPVRLHINFQEEPAALRLPSSREVSNVIDTVEHHFAYIFREHYSTFHSIQMSSCVAFSSSRIDCDDVVARFTTREGSDGADLPSSGEIFDIVCCDSIISAANIYHYGIYANIDTIETAAVGGTTVYDDIPTSTPEPTSPDVRLVSIQFELDIRFDPETNMRDPTEYEIDQIVLLVEAALQSFLRSKYPTFETFNMDHYHNCESHRHNTTAPMVKIVCPGLNPAIFHLMPDDNPNDERTLPNEEEIVSAFASESQFASSIMAASASRDYGLFANMTSISMHTTQHASSSSGVYIDERASVRFGISLEDGIVLRQPTMEELSGLVTHIEAYFTMFLEDEYFHSLDSAFELTECKVYISLRDQSTGFLVHPTGENKKKNTTTEFLRVNCGARTSFFIKGMAVDHVKLVNSWEKMYGKAKTGAMENYILNRNCERSGLFRHIICIGVYNTLPEVLGEGECSAIGGTSDMENVAATLACNDT